MGVATNCRGVAGRGSCSTGKAKHWGWRDRALGPEGTGRVLGLRWEKAGHGQPKLGSQGRKNRTCGGGRGVERCVQARKGLEPDM